MNHAVKAIAHEIKIRQMAYFYSAAERRSRGALWPSFAPARISITKGFPNSRTTAAFIVFAMLVSPLSYFIQLPELPGPSTRRVLTPVTPAGLAL
jgi:hypothetical protein